MLDYWANVFWDDPKRAEEEVVNEDFDADLAAMEAEVLAAAPASRPDGEGMAQLAEAERAIDAGEWEPVADDKWS